MRESALIWIQSKLQLVCSSRFLFLYPLVPIWWTNTHLIRFFFFGWELIDEHFLYKLIGFQQVPKRTVGQSSHLVCYHRAILRSCPTWETVDAAPRHHWHDLFQITRPRTPSYDRDAEAFVSLSTTLTRTKTTKRRMERWMTLTLILMPKTTLCSRTNSAPTSAHPWQSWMKSRRQAILKEALLRQKLPPTSQPEGAD